MRTLSREQIRQVDRLAIEELGIPGVVLMENAGRAVAEIVLELVRKDPRPPREQRVAIFCGSGNNGGDGYVAARHLHNAGVQVAIYSAAEAARLTGDAAVNRAIADKMQLARYEVLTEEQLNAVRPQLEQTDILVDALLGTGFTGELRPHLAAVVRRCNALGVNGKKVVAVDVPSGLDCNTGKPSSATVRADVTVTFVAMKSGYLQPDATPYLGRVVVADIGTPPELLDRV